MIGLNCKHWESVYEVNSFTREEILSRSWDVAGHNSETDKYPVPLGPAATSHLAAIGGRTWASPANSSNVPHASGTAEPSR